MPLPYSIVYTKDPPVVVIVVVVVCFVVMEGRRTTRSERARYIYISTL